MERDERLERLGMDRYRQVCLAIHMGVPELGALSRVPKGKRRARARKDVRAWLRKSMGFERAQIVSEIFRPARAQKRQQLSGQSFYDTPEWKQLRYDALKRSRGVCELCGAGPSNGSRLNVDHILPISKFPALKLEPTNLQVLCADCNRGKGARDTTDWRRVEEHV